jgi:hypothetical protein
LYRVRQLALLMKVVNMTTRQIPFQSMKSRNRPAAFEQNGEASAFPVLATNKLSRNELWIT